ncbi:MAG TPA: hypothetical protein VG406_28825 [Isosphaeraceae bacterium]|jgi:hypothetical protein|nr:hypothetical protein [Isosphaeraceae bacterium]
MSLAPTLQRKRRQTRLTDLIAMVVVAGVALAVARGLREASRGPRGMETILTPTLLALGFWAGVVLAEGIAARLRRHFPTDSPRRRGLAWRFVFLAALATTLLAQGRLLSRYQVALKEGIDRFAVDLARRYDRSGPIYKQVFDDFKKYQASGGFFNNLSVSHGMLTLLLLGLLLAEAPRPATAPARPASSGRRPSAGWLYLGLLVAAPVLVVVMIESFGHESWIEGVGADRRWTWRARPAPIVAFGAVAWLGAAEWLARDLRSASRPPSRRSIAYRFLTLGAAAAAAIALVFRLPLVFPWSAETSWDPPIDGPRAFWIGMTLASLAAGIAARRAAPARARPLPMALRLAKGAAVVALAVAALMLVVAAWEEEMETIKVFWPSFWHGRTFDRIVHVLYLFVHGAFRTFLWGAALVYLAAGVVAMIGPRRLDRQAGDTPRLIDLAPSAWKALGVVVVTAVVGPYLSEAFQFDDQLQRGMSLAHDLLERLNASVGVVVESIDVELVVLAPGAYWLVSRLLDGFAPPADAPLDHALADGPSARRFAADWLSLLVLLASAPPIAFAGMLILLD